MVYFFSLVFVKEDVLLHLLEVDFIVECDDVLGVASLLVDHTFSINLGDVLFA